MAKTVLMIHDNRLFSSGNFSNRFGLYFLFFGCVLKFLILHTKVNISSQEI